MRSLSLSKRVSYWCWIWSSRTVTCASAAPRSRTAASSSSCLFEPVIASNGALRISAAAATSAIA